MVLGSVCKRSRWFAPDQYSKHLLVLLRFFSYGNILRRINTLNIYSRCYVSFHMAAFSSDIQITLQLPRPPKSGPRTLKFRPLKKYHVHDTV